MAVTGSALELYNWMRQSLPAFLFANEAAAHETWEGIAKALSGPFEEIKTWLLSTFVLHAEGPWLDALGEERSVYRTAGESDDAYRTRIRTIDDTVTRPALVDAANAVLTAEHLATGVRIVNLRTERGYYSTRASGRRTAYFKSATGESYRMGRSGVSGGILGANTAATRVANSATIAADAAKRRDLWQPSSFIVVVPYGATTAARAAIRAVIAKRKAAGFMAMFEYRESP